MNTISNEEKIEELAEKSPINWISKEDKCTYRQGFVCGATKIAKWKDKEHAKEKQQWIDKACEWIEKLMVASGNYDAYDIQENLRDFKKSMKGE